MRVRGVDHLAAGLSCLDQMMFILRKDGGGGGVVD